MNLILLRSGDWLDSSRVCLRDHRADHIRQVLRSTVGDVLKLGRVGGLRGVGVIEQIDNDAIHLQVDLQEPPPPRHRFDLVLALPRPKMLRRIFRAVAEFGVEHLHLINTARVEKSYWQSPLLRPDKIEEALFAGMERSMDTVCPQVVLHKRFRPFVEDELPGLCGDRPCWLTDQGAPTALSDVSNQAAVVMIGPEGGFVPFEIALAQSVLATRVHLGRRILSVDTALTTVLAQSLDPAGPSVVHFFNQGLPRP